MSGLSQSGSTVRETGGGVIAIFGDIEGLKREE
jgi:hypothetical protein